MEESPLLPLSYGWEHLLIKPWIKRPESPLAIWFWEDMIITPH